MLFQIDLPVPNLQKGPGRHSDHDKRQGRHHLQGFLPAAMHDLVALQFYNVYMFNLMEKGF